MQSRRKFLKTSAVAVVAAAVANSLRAQERAAAPKPPVSGTPLETDIVVVGAGPAGIPAAIAAARAGARVVLLDEDALPGGAPVDMFVSLVCGLPHLGIYKEMMNRLAAKYEIKYDQPKNAGLWYFPSSFAFVLSQMIAEEPNITLITGATVDRVIMNRRGNTPRIEGVEFARAYIGRTAVRGKLVIDATGTGLVSELAGAACRYGREAKSEFNERYALEKADGKVMPCTLMTYLQRFRDGAKMCGWPLGGSLAESGTGFIDPQDPKQVRDGVYQYLKWTATALCPDTRDPAALAETQRKLLLEKVLPQADKFWEQGFAMHIAPKLGVRECRRVVGHRILTGEDMMDKPFPDDVISWGEYAVDSWGRQIPKELEGKLFTFGIPLSACVVKGVENLMTAGKHISGTSLAMSCYRVQPILGMLGQGVGTAAAMAVAAQTQPMHIDVRKLQKKLAAQGTLPKRYA